jgi:hypothetical protein
MAGLSDAVLLRQLHLLSSPRRFSSCWSSSPSCKGKADDEVAQMKKAGGNQRHEIEPVEIKGQTRNLWPLLFWLSGFILLVSFLSNSMNRENSVLNEGHDRRASSKASSFAALVGGMVIQAPDLHLRSEHHSHDLRTRLPFNIAEDDRPGSALEVR